MRYDRLRGEITSLPPDKFVIYDYLVEKGWEEKKLKDQESEKVNQENDEKNMEREKELEKKLQEDSNKDMVKHFKNLLKGLKRERFVDPEFPRTEEKLGGQGEGYYDHWKSFGDKKKLIKDSITIGDVKQGNLGDCYLISAFGVLGHDWVCRAFGMPYKLNGK